MDAALSIIHSNSPLLTKIKRYKRRALEIKADLNARPFEWGKYQSEFNQEINGIFRDMMLFEKENVIKGNEERLYKFKRFFREKLEPDFSYGEYIRWSQQKPYGYAGDFKIMHDIYENSPTTSGFDRLFDNYMQMSTISIAVRNRKNDFRRFLAQFITQRQNQQLRIMNLACGPCRELEEVVALDKVDVNGTIFDCVDNDEKALAFASQRLNHSKRFNFSKQNVVKLALKKNIEEVIEDRYTIIYSMGLFDYLDSRVSVRLVRNLRKLLVPGGILAVSDVRDKYSNPSLHFMELVGEWDLLYRDQDEFKRIFLEGGFSTRELSFAYEQQGIMQYIIATKRNKS